MQRSSGTVNSVKAESGHITEMNGAHMSQPAFPTIPGGTGMAKLIMEQVDPTQHGEIDDDSDSEDGQGLQGVGVPNFATHHGIKPGKKTKGRVKIKMEFIENKLRRYTTFSKRKTGIMKKVSARLLPIFGHHVYICQITQTRGLQCL